MSTTDLPVAAPPPFTSPSDCSCPPQCSKDRILRAAQNLFYRHGIRAVSVDSIAAEAQTTKVTLYRVFDSKDALVAECLQDQTQRFWAWWDETVSRHEGARGKLDTVFELVEAGIALQEAGRGCPIANTAVEIDDPAHPASLIVREHHAELRRRLRALCAELGARQPDALGDSLALLFSGVFTARVACARTESAGTLRAAARALIESEELGVGRTQGE